MIKNILHRTTTIFIFAFFIYAAAAQKVTEPKIDSAWVKPYAPFRIAGNLYYVGTYDLACYLITTSKGNILINTGTAASAQQIKNNIETLGFNYKDIKILLLNQAHYDHTGALATIKAQTGAKLMVDAADAGVLESGGRSDYELGKYGVSFKPVKPDRLLQDNDTISLGEMHIIMRHHPGHTKGSCSFLFTVQDSARTYQVLVANMPTIITDRRFADIKDYPSIQQDYAYSLQAMKNINFDIWLAAHASQFNLQAKHPQGSWYNPSAFTDKQAYYNQLQELQQRFDEKRQQDAKP